MKTPLLSSALATLALGCGPLLQADLAVEEWCQVMNRFEVPAAPEGGPEALTFQDDWALPKAPQVNPAVESEVDLSLVRVELSAEGAVRPDFLRAAEITATLDGHPVTLAQLLASDTVTAPLILVPPERTDLSELLDGGQVQVETHVEGTLPAHAWRLEVRACFRGRASLAVPAPWTGAE